MHIVLTKQDLKLIPAELQMLLEITVVSPYLTVSIAAYLINSFVTKTEIYLKSQIIRAFLLLYKDKSTKGLQDVCHNYKRKFTSAHGFDEVIL